MSKTDKISILQIVFFLGAVGLLITSIFYDSPNGFYYDILVIIKMIGVSLAMFLAVIILQLFREAIPIDTK